VPLTVIAFCDGGDEACAPIATCGQLHSTAVKTSAADASVPLPIFWKSILHAF
jgi:hypothetical protein